MSSRHILVALVIWTKKRSRRVRADFSKFPSSNYTPYLSFKKAIAMGDESKFGESPPARGGRGWINAALQ